MPDEFTQVIIPSGAYNAQDHVAIREMYTDDAISMPDDAPMLVGKAVIKKDLESSFANKKA